MALVSNIQLQDGAVKPPNLDTNLKFTAAGLTATEAIAVGTVPVSTSGSITVKSANDIRNWIQTTKTDGNVEIYMSNDARPDWALRVAGTADNAFVIANSYGSNCTAQFPAFSIGGAGAVGLGKTGATNILDIAYKNSATGGIQLTETQNSVGAKLIAEATSASIGSTSNHKLGFRVNGTTVAAFNTSTQFGIGTDSPGATLDVRGAAIFNEAGAAVDFRIEGDAEQNLFFVDGSADAIGMGTATPVDTSRLHIMGTDGDPAATHSGEAMLIVENCGQTFLELATGNANHAGLTFSDAAAATRGAVAYDHGTGLGGAADTMYFQTAGSLRVAIDQSGEVGIGTLQPSAMLHVVGGSDAAIRLQGSDTGSPALNFYQGSTCRGTIMYKDTGDNFVMDSAGKLTLQTSSTPRFVITNAGCVGIGTNAVASACSTQLDIFSAGSTTALQLRSGNTSAASSTIRGEGYRANGDAEQVLQVVGRNKNALIDLGIFEVSAEAKYCLGALELKTFDGSSMTTKMKITSGGNVGIGTATPSALLDVFGGTAHIKGTGGGCIQLVRNDGTGSSGEFLGVLDFVSTDASTGSCGTMARVAASYDSAGDSARLHFVTGASTGSGTPTLSEKMTILSGGNVGIATTAPNARLSIQANSSNEGMELQTPSSGAFQFGVHNVGGSSGTAIEFRRGGSDGFDTLSAIIDSSGNIGIGTNAASGRLQVCGNTVLNTTFVEGKLTVQDGNYGASGEARGDVSYGTIALMGCSPATGCVLPITFNMSAVAGRSRAAIAGVDLGSAGYCMGLAFYTRGAADGTAITTADEKMRILHNGNVGIGTTTPSHKLNVFGSINNGIKVVANTDTDFAPDSGYANDALIIQNSTAGNNNPVSLYMATGSNGEVRFSAIDDASNGDANLALTMRRNGGGRCYVQFWEAGTGNTGIGTTVPGAKLDAVGDASSTQYTIQACALNTLCSYGARIFGKGACDGFPLLMVNHNTDEVLRVNTGGRVGIMTSAPCCTAHVYGEFMVGKGQNVNANALIALNATTSAGAGGILQGTSNNGVDWQLGHYRAIIGSTTCSFFKLQAFGGISIGACAVCANSVEHIFVNPNGVVGIGTRDIGSVLYENSIGSLFQVAGTGANSNISVFRNHSLYGPAIILGRNGGDMGTNTLADATEGVGSVNFQANDGAKYVQVAAINVNVGSKAAASCMSGNIRFTTSGGSNGSLLERMRIHDCGRVSIGTSAECIGRLTSFTSAAGDYAYIGVTTLCDRGVAFFNNTNNSFNDIMFNLTTTRGTTTSYDFSRYNTGEGLVYRVRGSGEAQSDVGFNTPAADYSEFFESTTGVASERGRAVVLDGDKIRYYNSATDELDNIIGVTRPKEDGRSAGFVGNSAWSHWQGKYLTDDWGVYIYENTTVWDWSVETESGSETCSVYERDELAKDSSWTPPAGAVSSSQSVRKLNPAYDESLDSDYQSRDSRDEWWLIGLLGQVPVKAGEPVNPRWIKMKDISAAVEYYYIR